MIEYRFRVPSATIFTLYSLSKALEYPLEYPLRVVLGPALLAVSTCGSWEMRIERKSGKKRNSPQLVNKSFL
jgi:hypothetical protein